MRESVSIDRISTFFDGIARTRGLRAALVFGGSRQPDSLDPILERELEGGVAVMRVRLHPVLTISLPPSMSGSQCRHQVDEIEKTDPNVALPLLAGALRRISRLHSILLVIDDLHTMDDAMRGEFSLFLTSLADETLSILCFSRRSDPSIRCMIERYLLDEILLDRIECDQQRVLRNVGKRRISVVGEFAVHHPDGTTSPIRGERLRTILGVLIIDRMLATPLSPREFCRLSSGDIDDPVRAQKNMNMGIRRLVEVLGEESILRRGATPQLNLDLVSVDLLQAHRLLRDVHEACRKGPLMRAVDYLVAALDIVQGEEIFPGLDGGMYAAAREEFTENLQSSIIDVVRLLREEGEIGGVEPVLRRAIETVKDDEQLVELFHEVVGLKVVA